MNNDLRTDQGNAPGGALPPEEKIPELDFTQGAYERFAQVVDDPYFRDRDLYVIYEALQNNMQILPFGDFLKRYICRKAQMEGRFEDIPVSVYRQIICDSFADRQTPASFTPTSARLRNLAVNWLTQKMVKRSIVLLLGFGLGMSADDVNEFLTKALREQRLNAKDPFEVICWYCYSHGYSYPKFEQLWRDYAADENHITDESLLKDSTSLFKAKMLSVRNEEQLREYLAGLPIAPGTARQSVMARKQFDRLYRETREWAADFLTENEEDCSRIGTDRLRDSLDRDDRYYDFQKREILSRAAGRARMYRETDIGPAEIEQVAYAAIPKDSRGNLLPMKLSALSPVFAAGTRLTRQHINEILQGNAPITRYDLITLNFFAFSREDSLARYGNRLSRYSAFIDSTNRVLERSDMGLLYPVNPYESFLLMCIMSDDPIGTFSDIWELSYEEKDSPRHAE